MVSWNQLLFKNPEQKEVNQAKHMLLVVLDRESAKVTGEQLLQVDDVLLERLENDPLNLCIQFSRQC